MSDTPCAAPMSLPDLLEYWLDTAPDERLDGVEEHLLGCASCSARLEGVAALGAAIRSIVGEGDLRVFVSDDFVDRLARQGLRLRQYRVPPGGRVDCTVTARDDIMIARLGAPSALASRVDLVICDESGREGARVENIPSPGAGADIVFMEPIEALRRLQATVIRVRLLGVEEKEERLLGEYAFHHTPSSPG